MSVVHVAVVGATSAKIAKELDATFWISVGVLLVLAVVGGGVIMWWRGRALGKSGLDTDISVANSLRALRESGELSQEEYDRARRRLVERTLGERSAGVGGGSANAGVPGKAPPDSDGGAA